MKTYSIERTQNLHNKITAYIGTPFTFFEKIKARGSGSPAFTYRSGIHDFDTIQSIKIKSNNINIEAFHKGLCIYLNKRIERKITLIPFNEIDLILFKIKESVNIDKNGKEVVVRMANVCICTFNGEVVKFDISASNFKSGKSFFKKDIFQQLVEFSS
ncbi:hypothetical protein [Flammeovirga sp. SubArs3]|uniref:hypothetical protein n=1 Tax=Flammeovirga sp. SubArs3 TaxID=2995316 RepID=UPI00248C8B3B|nr:hypothetical protein [Flammeovirga sp. SubArs3]